MKNYRPYLISIAVITALIILFYFLGQIILPFFIGLAGAYLLSPLVKRFQKVIPNRNLAVSSLLLLTCGVIIGTIIIFGTEIVDDFKRLNGAFQTFADTNSEQIDETSEEVRSFITKIYDSDVVQENLQKGEEGSDSLATDGMGSAKSALSGITSFLGSSDKGETESAGGLNWVLVLFSSFAYFLYIIYTYTYFEEKFKKYFDSTFLKKKGVHQFIEDFKRIFLIYFRQRTKVVLLSMLVFLLAFIILDVPGALLIGVIAGLLCYIAHFHYLALVPLSLSCWVLSIEHDVNFFVYFGIVLGVFILVSVLEELVFNPKFMGAYSGMNPAIMIVSFAVWTHLFGPTFGTLIALPLTAVFLIYLDRILVYLKENLAE